MKKYKIIFRCIEDNQPLIVSADNEERALDGAMEELFSDYEVKELEEE